MFSFFKSKKEKERDVKSKAIDMEINTIQARKKAQAEKLARSIRELNELVERDGISGIFFVATGASRKSGRGK